jgi:hypothetical protein
MTRRIAMAILAVLLFSGSPMRMGANDKLARYLRPATISEMDWILLLVETKMSQVMAADLTDPDSLTPFVLTLKFDTTKMRVNAFALLDERRYEGKAGDERRKALTTVAELIGFQIKDYAAEFKTQSDLRIEFALMTETHPIVAVYDQGHLSLNRGR